MFQMYFGKYKHTSKRFTVPGRDEELRITQIYSIVTCKLIGP